jgi:predicted DsbA family dithiol-disulfide isomerase
MCAAHDAEKHQDLIDRLFEAGPTERSALVELAGGLGFDPAVFDSCLGSAATERALMDAVDASSADDVRATPTVVVRDLHHVGLLNAADLECLGAWGDRASAAARP